MVANSEQSRVLQPERNTDDGDDDAACDCRQPLAERDNDAQREPEASGWNVVFIGFYHPRSDAAVHAEQTGQDVHDLYQLVGDGIISTHEVF